MQPTIHATTVMAGPLAAMIRGAAGSGKSTLAMALIAMGDAAVFTALVSDDRTALSVRGGRLVASAPDTIAGLAEVRGIGIAPVVRHVRAGVVGLVVDLVDGEDAPRVPGRDEACVNIEGVRMPRLVLPAAPAGDAGAKAACVATALGLPRAPARMPRSGVESGQEIFKSVLR
ncbi:MAG: HPr kinase/phosphorylase [Rhodobiaceae bacterium]|nr:HPr kinase/phosphorylase [Rhodobiaceae bacterium]MCC0015608.1 HPr kinase/phosphorylase [Rhodobiaceae bacterium]MCC0054200.1 HPr kinase/phosphorylase [Rhodobiaceae bacterium]